MSNKSRNAMVESGKSSAGGRTRREGAASRRDTAAARRDSSAARHAATGEGAGERFLGDEQALLAVERRHPEGLTAAQVVEAFTAGGVRLSEATFRKWVQLGLLPRSRRVG